MIFLVVLLHQRKNKAYLNLGNGLFDWFCFGKGTESTCKCMWQRIYSF